MRYIDHIVIHHSGSPLSTTAAEIRKWHLGRGWKDVGYHFVIEGGGMLVPGRPLETKGAHVRGHNASTLGICVVGDNTSDRNKWSMTQILKLDAVVQVLQCVHPDALVCGHRDMPDTSTECPGLDIRKLLGMEEERDGNQEVVPQ